MSDLKVVETLYSNHNKFEILKREGGFIVDVAYYLHKNGKPHRSFKTLRDAIDAAKEEGAS